MFSMIGRRCSVVSLDNQSTSMRTTSRLLPPTRSLASHTAPMGVPPGAVTNTFDAVSPAMPPGARGDHVVSAFGLVVMPPAAVGLKVYGPLVKSPWWPMATPDELSTVWCTILATVSLSASQHGRSPVR